VQRRVLGYFRRHANEALRSPHARLVYRLPGLTADWRSVLVLSPVEPLQRLARLLPPPRRYLSDPLVPASRPGAPTRSVGRGGAPAPVPQLWGYMRILAFLTDPPVVRSGSRRWVGASLPADPSTTATALPTATTPSRSLVAELRRLAGVVAGGGDEPAACRRRRRPHRGADLASTLRLGAPPRRYAIGGRMVRQIVGTPDPSALIV